MSSSVSRRPVPHHAERHSTEHVEPHTDETVICILFYLWIFLFADLRKDDHVESKRGWMWEAIHFPLLFCVLLFLAGMVVRAPMPSLLTQERCCRFELRQWSG